jgi:hypothetical protein
VGFAVGAHDPSRPLVIDPVVLSYSTYLGGSYVDTGHAIAVDGDGNAYVAGETGSTNFPTTAGAFQTALGDGGDAFVTKLNATGTALIYSTYLGGNGNDYGYGIAVDGGGNAYVTGTTTSTNFPTTPGAFQTVNGGGLSDAFVTQLNADGTALVYSTYLGGSGQDEGFGIAVDGGGNAYVTGSTSSTDFPTTPGAFQTTLASSFGNAFVTKLTPDGTALAYSTYLGGYGTDVGRAIAVDGAGNACVTGGTGSTNFPTTPGAFQPTLGGTFNAFVTQLSADGTALIYSTYLGGSGSDQGFGIAVDGMGNAYVTGSTNSINFPTTPGAFQTTKGSILATNVFVTQLSADGTTLTYSTYLGGTNVDIGLGIAVDGAGNAYVTGWTGSTDFPTTPNAFQTESGGSYDVFVTKLSTDGTALVYSTYLGGNDADWGYAIAVDGAGSAYVTGYTNSSNFPTTPGAFQTTRTGSQNAFVTKLSVT